MVIRSFLYLIRNLLTRKLFSDLRIYGNGDVLDLGGGSFYKAVLRRGIPFSSWTTVDPSITRSSIVQVEPRVELICADGCCVPLPDECCDLVLSIQVLEHVYDPALMLSECARLCREGGTIILLVPQTSNIHMIPFHYYNFTRFWIQKALEDAGFAIDKLEPRGGAWFTIASRLFYMILQSLRVQGLSDISLHRRTWLFYFLFPFMTLFAVVAIPVCLLFSLADLSEEPNNHYIVATKVSSEFRS